MKVKICKLIDLKDGEIRTARVLARRIAVLKRGDEIFAFEADCKHMKQSLERGTIDGDVITCPAHGWRYNFTSGACLTEAWAQLKTYVVSVDDQHIWVDV